MVTEHNARVFGTPVRKPEIWNWGKSNPSVVVSQRHPQEYWETDSTRPEDPKRTLKTPSVFAHR